MLYVPTSTDIKFKAKAWIDVVGTAIVEHFHISCRLSR